MVGSGIRGAYVCARCQLSQLARSRHRPTTATRITLAQHAQQRYLVDEAVQLRIIQHSVSDHRRSTYFKSIAPNGKLVGRKGRRQRAKAEPLKIKSLDRDSEVLVLRDEPEEQAASPVKRGSEHDAESGQPTLQAEDIAEAMSQAEKEDTMTDEDVILAVEEHRPPVEIVDKAAYDKKAHALNSAFTRGQLRLYLRTQLKATSTEPVPQLEGLAGEQSAKSKGKNKGAKAKQPPQKGPSWKHLVATQWYKQSTNISTPVSLMSAHQPDLVRVPQGKASIIASILRQVWNTSVNAQAEARGEMELLLTPIQWRLLLTRTSGRLLGILRNSKLYTASQLERDAHRGVLRISGPRDEAMAIAGLFKDCFSTSSALNLQLSPAGALDDGSSALGRLTDKVLDDIMYMTSTVIVIDRPKASLDIAGLSRINTEDALRLLSSMLGTDTTAHYQSYKQDRADVEGVPVSAASSLQLHHRAGHLARLESGEHLSGSSASRPDDARLQQIGSHVVKHLKKSRFFTTEPPKQAKLPKKKRLSTAKSLWHADKVTVSPLKAIFGSMLPRLDSEPTEQKMREPRGKPSKLIAAAADAAPKQSSLPAFYTRIPRPFSLFSYFARRQKWNTPEEDMEAPAASVQLVARLVPLNISAEDTVKPSPSVQLPVTLYFTVLPASSQSVSPTGDSELLFDVGDGRSLRLDSVTAQLDRRVYDVSLPDLPVDLRLQQSTTIDGDIGAMMKIESFRAFVESIVTSYKSDTLRARPSLAMQPPPRFGGASRASPSAQGPVQYFFAGFELREVRRVLPLAAPPEALDKSDDWIVRNIEAGFTGGKRTELSVQAGKPAGQQLDKFVSRCLVMAGFIGKVHGRLVPIREHTVPLSEDKSQHNEGGSQTEVSREAASEDLTGVGRERQPAVN